jgi:hypothetical protein
MHRHPTKIAVIDQNQINQIFDVLSYVKAASVLRMLSEPEGITVRQDRFLEDGPAKDKDSTTLCTGPLAILSVGADGKPTVNNTAVLETRKVNFKLNTSKPFELNAGTTDVCVSRLSRFLRLPC